MAGTVTEVNESLEDAPEKINEDPYGEGWICKIKTGSDVDVSGLLDSESYSALIYLNEEVVEPCQRHSTAFFTVTIIMVNGTFKPINAHNSKA